MDKEREAFENHLKKMGKTDNETFSKDEDDSYQMDIIHFGWKIWQAAKASAVPECVWSEDLNEDMYGTWHTKCGNSFVLNEDSPTENQMKHCCYCGGKLIEAQEPSDD